jgi:hypothetical protein
MSAAWDEDVKKIAAALARGADPNAADELGTTPLHALALSSDARILREGARLLVAAGADPYAKDFRKRTPGQMSSKLAKILSELAPAKVTPAQRTASVDITHLFDLDRQPRVRGLYAKSIAQLARLLPGVLAPKAIERWKTDRVEVTVTIGKAKHVIALRAYAHGQFDVDLFPKLNALLPARAPKLYVQNALPSGDCSVVALTAAPKASFMTSKDFARARKTFEARDRELTEDE